MFNLMEIFLKIYVYYYIVRKSSQIYVFCVITMDIVPLRKGGILFGLLCV